MDEPRSPQGTCVEPGPESGFAVPVVLLALITAFALGSAALVSATNAQRGTVRDKDVKVALTAAESGVMEALLHYNRITTPDGTPCLTGNPVSLNPVAGGGWCAPVSRSMSNVPGATFSYWVKPTVGTPAPGTTPTMEIVSQGNAGGTVRKIKVEAPSTSGLRPFAGNAGVIGLNSILLNSNAIINADVATNGSITMNSNAELHCDFAQVGPGRNVIQQGNAQYDCPPPVQGTTSLPPVNQGDVATNNDNDRLFAYDTYSGSQPVWDAGRRELTLNSNTTLTLGGSDYSFCRVILNSNTAIYTVAGSDVRIWFDSPENCGYASGANQLTLNSNSRISATGGSPSKIAMLFVGSDTRRTTAILNSNTQANEACEQDFVVYAPRTDITMNSNSFFCGAIAGRTILGNSNTSLTQSNLSTDFELPNSFGDHYTVDDFIDCATTDVSPPDDGC